MTRTDIDWADYTINPMVGCKHNCWYCYAKRMNSRFKFVDQWTEPEFFPQRMDFKTPKIPKNRNRLAAVISPQKPVVFIGSMTDLFGTWVNTEWVKMIIEMARNKPEITFMSLTKNPKGALGYDFPENWIFGVTIDCENPKSDRNKMFDFYIVNCQHKFISAETLLGNFKSVLMPYMLHYEAGIMPDFIIVGAMTGPGAIKTKPEWLQVFDRYIFNNKILYKDNILFYKL